MTDRPSIDACEVHRVAALAHLVVSDEEAQALAQDLDQILAYVGKLQAVDVTSVAAPSHPVELEPSWRDDTVVPGLGVDAALANAPERIGQGFGVPKIIE